MEDTLLVKIVKANCTSEQKGKHRKILKLSPDFLFFILFFYFLYFKIRQVCFGTVLSQGSLSFPALSANFG